MNKTLLTACTLNALALPAIAEDPQKPGYFGEFMDLTGRMIADSVVV
ncbi:hypothetical protein ACGYLI_17085 [Sulfitobacter sp. 1A13421]